jgi:hypothetical protein
MNIVSTDDLKRKAKEEAKKAKKSKKTQKK